ncbi:hypothetical protein [Methylotuvimicrobium sp. KM2]|uniref:hypothetical protein n=1 Tax=Methylotuvimicrobium sp. KM2 TaxID=3133976 RepID=UPI003100C7F2
MNKLLVNHLLIKSPDDSTEALYRSGIPSPTNSINHCGYKSDRYQYLVKKYLFLSFNALAFNKLKQLDFVLQTTKITINNTPPASRKISAPRGVTRFWRPEKSFAILVGGQL